MSTKSKKDKKQHVVLPYILRPLLYFAIAMVFIIPASLGLLKLGVNTVHRAQPHFKRTVSEIQTDSTGFTPSTQENGSVAIPAVKAGKKVGELQCASAGLSCDVFYGANRVSYREGVGLESDIAMPGEKGTVRIKGYAGYGMKALENLKENDEITLTTLWGVYRYRVDSAAVTTEEAAGKADLVLSCAKSKDAYATVADKRLFVTATLVSGPTAEEVLS